jgi:malate synthase
METTLAKDKITSLFSEASEVSFNERKNAINEEVLINKFLDTILDLKKDLTERNDKLSSLLNGTQELTWFTDELNESDLRLLNDLLSVMGDLHYRLIRQYATINKILSPKKIASEELKSFKIILDDLKESCTDLEMIFLNFRQDEEFKNLTDELLSL